VALPECQQTGGAMRDPINYWRTLTYHDPALTLRRLRALELELAGVDLPLPVRRLRTREYKKYREWRDAALFTYGMGLAQSVDMRYATDEARDYDFVTMWRVNDEVSFCPVQAKELVPADLNADATLDDLLHGLSRYGGATKTVLAVKLNRRGRVNLASLKLPAIPFAQLWFFWAAARDASKWCLYGDALAQPGQLSFDYPA